MKNQLLLRGCALIVIALCFGIPSVTHKIGGFAHPGPGLFPLLVSCMVGLIGLVMMLRTWFEPAQPMTLASKNILIVLASLVGFALIAKHANAALAIAYLVFVSTLAGADYSVVRNLKICAVLIAIAFALHTLLGLNLRLI